MTKEYKEILLKYLCMALPYGVIVQYKGHNTIIKNKFLTGSDLDCNMEYYKPYLRSMSSMTQEEKTQMVHDCYVIFLDFEYKATDMVALWNTPRVINWLLEHHFDFLGLISKGLAIEVTENNPYK